ncbi:MAG: hypothetical protein COT74_12140 [Bdellovibrionales bacterium CG10_big_fil_rev_8_21_14_0_10_45_34]|nr:MAG: hypothetical protein COT74_12140 [Bdellovibrionales bacterium CG10_big_fil_rev_8_21_14_0_10_45_34]
MALEELKSRFKDQLQNAWSAFETSTVYLQIREKYDDLNPAAQKGVLGFLSVAIISVLIWIPYTFWASSEEQLSYFIENKELIREVLRVQKQLAASSDVPIAIDSGMLRTQVESQLQTVGLLPEQIQAVNIADFTEGIKIYATGVVAEGIRASVINLNVTQIVEIGYKLQQIDPSAKMIGMKVRASPERSHYYNVEYELATFRSEAPAEPPAGGNKKSNNG